jgi:LmbE family N-acetylglucosaminyl deacetylase
VLAVFAHPDDESIACGGTLARLADDGAHVVVMCASRGERGSPDGTFVNEELGGVRARELRDAAAVLGIAEVLQFDHPDGDLRWAHVAELHAQIMMTVSHLAPAAVITFGEDGLYWHLDHIGMHERTTTALKMLEPNAPPLYYVTMPSGAMRAVADAAGGRGWTIPSSGFWSLSPSAFGECAPAATIIVNVEPWLARKMASIRCHKSQMSNGHPFMNLETAEIRRWLGVEHFRRAAIGGSKSGLLELLRD